MWPWLGVTWITETITRRYLRYGLPKLFYFPITSRGVKVTTDCLYITFNLSETWKKY